MTRRRSRQSFDRRLDAIDEQHREPDPNDWRALLDLPASASQVDGWRALLRGDGGDEAWHAYLAASREDE